MLAQLFLGLGLAASARAHTVFTTFFVDGVSQGDGTCVRLPADPVTATYPIANFAGSDMVCGANGLAPVAFTCPVAPRATLTFEFREYPDGSQPGRAIDASHKGPCAVYVKQLAPGARAETSPSSGWFKIWEEGYDASTKQWCTEKLIAQNGLLSVALPAHLPTGSAYLVRPELLSLHRAAEGDPQFYVGCAQIFLAEPGAETGASPSSTRQTLVVPDKYAATFPGHVKAGDPAVSFDLWAPKWPYTMPGPPVFTPAAASAKSQALAKPADLLAVAGVQLVPAPSDCLIKNANWCGVEVPKYTTEAGCWAASEDCYQQEAACYDTAPPTGSANCGVWDRQKCAVIQAACAAGDFTGPPNYGQPLTPVEAAVPQRARVRRMQ